MADEPLEVRVVQSPQQRPYETMNRRHLLKLLAGTGGAAAWSLLPGKWTRPVVEAGMLPMNYRTSRPV